MNMRNHISWIRAASLGLLLTAGLAGKVYAIDFYLKAAATTKTMPGGGPVIPMWGYVLCDATFTPQPGQTVQVPGPRLVVPPGETTLNIHLMNGLPPVVGDTGNTSLVIPGLPAAMVPTWTDNSTGSRTSAAQRVRSFTQETAQGASSVYSWTALQPGTFLYESGTHPSIQVQMGLYGCVTIDAAAGQAYPGVAYDNEGVLIFSEIDPAIHAAIDGGTYGTTMTSTMYYVPKYFLINGAPYPDTLSLPFTTSPPAAGQRLLLRFLNPGEETHVPVLQDLYMTLVARDGNPLPYPQSVYSHILVSGSTADGVVVVPADNGSHPIFDRRLRLTNGQASNGGMLTYLNPAAAPPGPGCPARVGDTLMLTKSAGQITFNWTDIPLATSYEIYQSTSASDPLFAQQATTSPLLPPSGTSGCTLPMPTDNLIFFLVAGDTSSCVGPKR